MQIDDIITAVVHIAVVPLGEYTEEQVREIANKHNVSEIQNPITINVLCMFSDEEDLRAFVGELVNA